MQNPEPAKKSYSRKALLSLFILLSFATMIICTALIITTARIVEADDVYQFEENGEAESAALPPETGADILAFLNRLLEPAADSSRVRQSVSTEISVENDSVAWSGDDSEKNILLYVKNSILDAARTYYPKDTEGVFVKGSNDVPVIALSTEDCGEILCTAEKRTEEKRNTTTGNMEEILLADYYAFNIAASGGSYPMEPSSGIAKTFAVDTKNMQQLLQQRAADSVDVKQALITPGVFHIYAEADRLSGQIMSIEFTRSYHVQTTLTFKGMYASLGTKTLSFDYLAKEKYSYEWAGIQFGSAEVSVEPGGDKQVSVNATMNDGDAYDIAFELSDTARASIDELGYLTGLQEGKTPITLTVKLDYLGNEYTDTCEVYVKYDVEEVDLDESRLKLAPGESFALQVKISPKKATIQDVMWVSDDDAIAAVDSTGRVTARSAGETRIHAISQDGNFMGSCTVTVTENGGG